MTPPNDSEQCPHRGIEHSDGMEWTCSKTGDTQRIADVIAKLEVMRERDDRRGDQTKLNFHDGVAYGCEHAIALLRESKP